MRTRPSHVQEHEGIREVRVDTDLDHLAPELPLLVIHLHHQGGAGEVEKYPIFQDGNGLALALFNNLLHQPLWVREHTVLALNPRQRHLHTLVLVKRDGVAVAVFLRRLAFLLVRDGIAPAQHLLGHAAVSSEEHLAHVPTSKAFGIVIVRQSFDHAHRHAILSHQLIATGKRVIVVDFLSVDDG